MEQDEYETLFADLRRLAATDPRKARESLARLLDTDSAFLEPLFRGAAAAGEGRLRQLIANTLRVRGEQGRFASHLQAWREVEPDEFTKRALDAALEGTARVERQPEKRQPLVDPRWVESYRYVSDRLRHQLRNALMEPLAHLIRLRTRVELIEDVAARDEISAQVASLNDAVGRIGRMVELDVRDGHFEMRSIRLSDWLNAFNADYKTKFKAVTLRLVPQEPDERVLASDYLLRTVFWNLWINAQQAVPSDCTITVRFASVGRTVELVILDNGDGFPGEMAEAGLPDAKPREGHRGRGLLEVQDAMERLHGAAEWLRYEDGSHRMKLTFPRDIQ